MSPTYSVCKDHGYITGEHFTCPTCGKSAEVYSRITGYYRPVQNWNDGKSQEYKNRTVYDITHSHLKKKAARSAGKVSTVLPEVQEEDGILLFTTNTCPNCKIAKQMLEGMDYQIVDAEQHPDLVSKLSLIHI